MYENLLVREIIRHAQAVKKEGKVPRFRFAPQPTAKMTLGHLKGLLILDALRKKTSGLLYIRFDDSNPRAGYKRKHYLSVLNLAKKYNISIDGIYKSSDNLKKYTTFLDNLLKKEQIFFCNCFTSQAIRYNPKTCNCSLNKEFIEKKEFFLLNPPKGLCLRTIKGSTPSTVVARVLNSKFYPTLALQGAIDDYLQKINFVIRGRDLQSIQKLQESLYGAIIEPDQLAGFKKPKYYYWGRIALWDSKTKKVWPISKSILKDTFKFPSLDFFERFGYFDKVLSQFLLSYGFTKNDINLDVCKLNQLQIKEIFKNKKQLQVIFKLSEAKKGYFFLKTKNLKYTGFFDGLKYYFIYNNNSLKVLKVI